MPCAQFDELLSCALALLSQTDRWLIEELFWARHTETQIAGVCGVSQQAISKRKRAILRNLRGWMNAAEEAVSIESDERDI
jgi:DNA-directed RNA polymerase specialized sigma subunit